MLKNCIFILENALLHKTMDNALRLEITYASIYAGTVHHASCNECYLNFLVACTCTYC